MTEYISMTDGQYWANEDRSTALYHQALDEIEAENGGEYQPGFYQRVIAQHKELCDKEGVILFTNQIAQAPWPLWMEDRETRIASGESQWQAGGEV